MRLLNSLLLLLVCTPLWADSVDDGWQAVVAEDYAQALRLIEPAAREGDARAEQILGHMYYSGLGVKKDYKRAAGFFQKAADQGHADAQHMLGWLYWNGWGVKQNWSLAYHWMKKAADQGTNASFSGVGYLLQEGLGTKKDYSEALAWHRKAVAGGDLIHSAHHLGRMHEGGTGVIQDYVEAYKWYAVSAAGDLEVSRQAMDRLRKEMTKGQVAEAQKAALALKEGTPAPTAAPTPPMIAAPGKTHTSDVDLPGYRFNANPSLFALVIGVDRYKDLPRAEFAERDAAAVKGHLLALGYPERNIVTLTGPDATISGMRKYVDEWLPRNVREGAHLFFYFSGHGAPDPATGQAYLVPWDGDASFLKSTAYPVSKLYASLKKLRAERVWVALDACFSGAGGRSVLAKGARPLVTKMEFDGNAAKGLVVLSAAGGSQITGTLENEGHGIFTYHLLKGIERAADGAPRELDIGKVHDYLKPRVEDDARRQNRDQTPAINGPEDRRRFLPLIRK